MKITISDIKWGTCIFLIRHMTWGHLSGDMGHGSFGDREQCCFLICVLLNMDLCVCNFAMCDF